MTRKIDNRPLRCINQRCTHKSECEFGVRNQRAKEIFGDDLEGLRLYGPRPINPVSCICKRYMQSAPL